MSKPPVKSEHIILGTLNDDEELVRVQLDNGKFNEGWIIHHWEVWPEDGAENPQQGSILTTQEDFFDRYEATNPLNPLGPGVIGWGYVNTNDAPFTWVRPNHFISQDLYVANVHGGVPGDFQVCNFMIHLKRKKVNGAIALLGLIKERKQGASGH